MNNQNILKRIFFYLKYYLYWIFKAIKFRKKTGLNLFLNTALFYLACSVCSKLLSSNYLSKAFDIAFVIYSGIATFLGVRKFAEYFGQGKFENIEAGTRDPEFIPLSVLVPNFKFYLELTTILLGIGAILISFLIDVLLLHLSG
ncbi:MAG: hypothetical protein AB4063_01050 [Crocosphaera sp.]